MKVKMLWQEIIEQLKVIPHNHCADINPPASENEIASLEKTLSLNLPDSFKEYLSVMNGQKNQTDKSLIAYTNFFTIERIIESWNMMNANFNNEVIDWKTEDKIKAVIWHKAWIPFTSNMGGNNMLVIDLSPAKNGTLGQIFLWHPGMGEEDEIIADSFAEFSEGLLRRLIHKEYTIDDLHILSFNDYYLE